MMTLANLMTLASVLNRADDIRIDGKSIGTWASIFHENIFYLKILKPKHT